MPADFEERLQLDLHLDCPAALAPLPRDSEQAVLPVWAVLQLAAVGQWDFDEMRWAVLQRLVLLQAAAQVLRRAVQGLEMFGGAQVQHEVHSVCCHNCWKLKAAHWVWEECRC